LSRINFESNEELEFDLEEGDFIIHIKADGEVGKVCIPDMNSKVQNSGGYKKLLDMIEILKPGSKQEFVDYYDKQRKGSIH
jgi:hypothetical protein|tara:strand:+ start:365 stop:607 length:243 start_codon:yes stop_codon:yes gene_type:complete